MVDFILDNGFQRCSKFLSTNIDVQRPVFKLTVECWSGLCDMLLAIG